MRFVAIPSLLCLLVGATGCGVVRAAVHEHRWYDACQAADATGDEVAPWSDLDRAGLGEEIREARGGTLTVRTLRRAELEAIVGAEVLQTFDQSFGVVELSADTAQPVDVAFDTRFASVRVPELAGDDVALYHALEGVLALPHPPEPKIVRRPNPVRNALGVVGIVTLVTPLATVLSGQDAMSPLLEPDEERIEPTEAEWTAWHEDPAMAAARRLRAYVAEKDGRCEPKGRCVLRAFVIGPERGTFDVTAMRVRLRYATHGPNGGSCPVEDRVLIRLPRGPEVIAQLRDAVPPEGAFRLAEVESARANSVVRWWSGWPDAEPVTRDAE